MRIRLITILAGALLCLAPIASWADLGPYSQDFEGLTPAPQELPATSLGDDGWLVFGNVFDADGNYLYGYGAFPAPNTGQAFSSVDVGQGDPPQGMQQLSVFSDYNNMGHDLGQLIESNVFQEQVIGAADIGTTWRFEFDARRSNLEGSTTARAFFKTLHPRFFFLSRFIWIDMTNVPDEWDRYSLEITIDPDIEGHIFQFGFLNTASNGEGSGIYYDNVNFDLAPLNANLDIKPGSCVNPLNTRTRGVLPVALLGAGEFDVSDIDVGSLQLEGVAPLRWAYEDVGEPFVGAGCGCNGDGPDGWDDLTLKFRIQDVIEAIGSSPNGDLVLTLTGTLLDGTPIEGTDCMVVVGRGGSPPDGGDSLMDIQHTSSGDTETDNSSLGGFTRPSTSRRSRGVRE